MESTCPGFTSPGTFRSQVFSTSQRLAPPDTSRVYFAPMTPLGFPLQSFLLHTSRVPYRSPIALLALPSCVTDRLGCQLPGACDIRPRFRASQDLTAAFRAFLLRGARSDSLILLEVLSADALLSFCLSRVYPLRRWHDLRRASSRAWPRLAPRFPEVPSDAAR